MDNKECATWWGLRQPPLMLTHEEWVNGDRYESLLARGRPTNAARDTN